MELGIIELSGETAAILLLVLLFLLLSIALYRVITKKSKQSGGFITTMASTYDLHNKDQQQAIQEISEKQAHKKMDEQTSSDPLSKEKK